MNLFQPLESLDKSAVWVAPREAGFTTSLSAPKVSLSKKIFGASPKERYKSFDKYWGYDGTSIPNSWISALATAL